MRNNIDILIVEPYLAGSHEAWAEGYKKTSRHNVKILSLEGRFWKWRMHGGAVTLARRFRDEGHRPQVILATDMLDVTTFLALAGPAAAATPLLLYFHENQLTYPWAPGDRDVARERDGHYAFINFTSALAAGRVLFNSRYHMESFLAGLRRFLRTFPDYNETGAVDEIEKKSAVLPVGIDLSGLGPDPSQKEGPPLILWNHRWEYDKNPADFFRALYEIMERGLYFEVAILGENFRRAPTEFEEAKGRLGKRLIHFGFVEDRGEYAKWLTRADILPVTSLHDFFGCSVIEAVYCGTWPILPRRLAYPEHLPEELHERFFYDDFTGLVSKLEEAITNIDRTRKSAPSEHVKRYDWSALAAVYDDMMERAAESHS